MTDGGTRGRLALLGALLLIAGLALWLAGGDTDARLAAALRLDRGSPAAPAIRLLSHAGGAAVLAPAALGIVALLALRRRLATALWLLLVIASGRLMVEGAKLLIGRARPDEAGRLVEVGSWSFPSSHAAGAMLTVAALLLALRAPRLAQAAAILFVIAVGLSRLALGVHWPSDVLAGWGFGLLWAVAGARWRPGGRHVGRPQSMIV